MNSLDEYLLRFLSLVQQSQTQAKKRSRKFPAWTAACAKVLGWRKKLETFEARIKVEPKRMVGGQCWNQERKKW